MVVPKKAQKSRKLIIKLLVPNVVTGGIIGKGGENVQEITSKTGAVIRVSGRDVLFPFTEDRIVLIISSHEHILEAVTYVHSKLRSAGSDSNANSKKSKARKGRNASFSSQQFREMKIVVTESSAGMIIGKKGERVRKIQKDHGVRIGLSSKDYDGFERVCSISGEESAVNDAIGEILDLLKDDVRATLNPSLAYPPYDKFDNFFQRGPPPPIPGYTSPKKEYPPIKCDGYQSEQQWFHHGHGYQPRF